jgi:hypothetical protein
VDSLRIYKFSIIFNSLPFLLYAIYALSCRWVEAGGCVPKDVLHIVILVSVILFVFLEAFSKRANCLSNISLLAIVSDQLVYTVSVIYVNLLVISAWCE